MEFDKHFTLAEANALLPWVRHIFEEVHQISATVPPHLLSEKSEKAEARPNPIMQVLAFDHERALRRGHHAWVHDMAELPREAQLHAAWRNLSTHEKLELISGLLQALIERGLIIQDVARGLIDFPADTAAGEVLLCYELKDGASIVAWHPVDAGFAGRRPIEELPE
jgi:hypothetical protein